MRWLARGRGLWLLPAALLVVAAVFFLFPPFYGLMDDSRLIFQAPQFLHRGSGDRIWDFLRADFEVNGEVRPFSPLMLIALYGYTSGHPLALHLLNAAFVLLSFALLALSLGPLWKRMHPGSWPQEDSFFPLFFSLLLLFPWSHHAFVVPSLQDKVVYLFAAFALRAFTSARLEQGSRGRRLFWCLLALVAGVFSHHLFVLFFPLLLAASLLGEDSRLFPGETLAVAACMLLLIGLIWLLGRHSIYVSRDWLGNSRNTLVHSRSLWVLAAVGLLSLGKAFSGQAPIRRKLACAGPAISLLAFLVVMVPVGLGGHMNSFAAPFVAFCLLPFLPLLPRGLQPRASSFPGTLLAGAALLLLGLEVGADSLVKNDLGRLIASRELREVASAGPVYAPCLQGMDSMNVYARRFFGYSLGAELPPPHQAPPPGKTHWIVARHLGCWPASFDPGELVRSGRASVVWRGHARWSWRLLELNN